MSKNSLHAHLETGKVWIAWLKAGGDKKAMKDGKEKQKKWAEEDKKNKK